MPLSSFARNDKIRIVKVKSSTLILSLLFVCMFKIIIHVQSTCRSGGYSLIKTLDRGCYKVVMVWI